MIGRLLLAALVVVGCTPGAGDAAAESAWIENNSSMAVVVVVTGIGAFRAPPNASGVVYSTADAADSPGRRVLVASSGRCETLGLQLNSRRRLLVTVDADGAVRFEQGANFEGRATQGTIESTTECQV